MSSYRGSKQGSYGNQRHGRKANKNQSKKLNWGWHNDNLEDKDNGNDFFWPPVLSQSDLLNMEQPMSIADYNKWVIEILAANDNAENDDETKRKIDQAVMKMKKAGISKVLFVCSANFDRSPTAENLFKNKEGLEVKSAGVSRTAFKKLTPEMIEWADKIYVMEPKFQRNITRMVPSAKNKIESLDIGDFYQRNSPALKRLILKHLNENLDGIPSYFR